MSVTWTLELGGYVQNTSSFTFADTGFFSDVGQLRLEGTAGNELYALESHIIFSATAQPLDPIQGLKKRSLMKKLFDDMSLSLMEAFPEGTTNEDTVSQGEPSFMLDSRTIRYLPYTSYYPKESFTIDRLLIKLFIKRADIYLGRQQIAWGTGYAFNPTDIWNQKNPLDVSAPKKGVSALRIEVPLGELSNLNIIGLPGADLIHSSAGIRLKTNIAGYDLSLSASRFMDADRELASALAKLSELPGVPVRFIAGADMAGQIKDVGIWTEVAIINHKYDEDVMPDYEFDSTHIQLDVGLDYTFKNGLYIMGEYYYNGLGESDDDSYHPGLIYLQYMGDMAGLATRYAMLGLKKTVWDKVDLSLFSMVNIDDWSAMILPQLDYYWSDEISVNLSANISAGEKEYTELGSLCHSVLLKMTAYF